MPTLLIAILVCGIAWFVWRRSNIVFEVQFADGRAYVFSGQVPPSFLAVAHEVAPHCNDGWVKAVRAEQGMRLESTGIDEGTEQRLRNALRLTVQAGLRSGPSPMNRDNVERTWWLVRILRMLLRR